MDTSLKASSPEKTTSIGRLRHALADSAATVTKASYLGQLMEYTLDTPIGERMSGTEVHAQLLENLAAQGAQDILVLHEEHRLRSVQHLPRRLGFRPFPRPRLHPGKVDPDRRPLPHLGVHRDHVAAGAALAETNEVASVPVSVPCT